MPVRNHPVVSTSSDSNDSRALKIFKDADVWPSTAFSECGLYFLTVPLEFSFRMGILFVNIRKGIVWSL